MRNRSRSSARLVRSAVRSRSASRWRKPTNCNPGKRLYWTRISRPTLRRSSEAATPGTRPCGTNPRLQRSDRRRAARLAGRIEGEQAAQGVSIAFEDLLIAATALQLGFGVATGNLRHFRVVPGLSVVLA